MREGLKEVPDISEFQRGLHDPHEMRSTLSLLDIYIGGMVLDVVRLQRRYELLVSQSPSASVAHQLHLSDAREQLFLTQYRLKKMQELKEKLLSAIGQEQ